MLRYFAAARVWCLTGVLSFATPLVAAEDEAPPTSQPSDAKAQAVVKQLSEHLQKLGTFSVDIHMTTSWQAPGGQYTKQTMHRLSVSKPDKLAVVCKKGLADSIVLDGERAHVQDPMKGKSVVVDIPGGAETLNTILEAHDLGRHCRPVLRAWNHAAETESGKETTEAALLQRVRSWPGALLTRTLDLSTELTADIGGCTPQVRHLGMEVVDGVECHKLEYRLKDKGGWLLLVEAGDQPLIREVRTQATEKPDSEKKRLPNRIEFKNWKLDQEIPATEFAIPSPKEKPAKPQT